MKRKQVATLLLTENRNGREDHPFGGEGKEITLLTPPCLGLPFLFAEGHTSQVIAGAFTPPVDGDAPAVWTFQTANSAYRLEVRMVPMDEAELLFAGGPVGNA